MSRTLRVADIGASLAKLQKLGHLEDTFQVVGHTIKIRTLPKKEVQTAYLTCKPAWEAAQESEDSFSLAAWIRDFQTETLAYAILAIDELNLEDVAFIETDQIDEKSQKPIHIQKHVFLRNILSEWEDSVVTTIYSKFQELEREAEDKAKEGVVFKDDSVNLKLRIDELEEELQELREKLSEDVPEELEESLSETTLKEAIFAPQEQDGYVYGDRPAVKVEAPQTAPDDPERLVYVDETGRELTDEELALAQEQERLYQRRLEDSKRAEEMRQRRPLNQTNVEVKEGAPSIRHPESVRTVNAGSARQDTTDEEMVVAEGFAHDPVPLRKSENVDWDRVVINEQPSPNVNKNFVPLSNKHRY